MLSSSSSELDQAYADAARLAGRAPWIVTYTGRTVNPLDIKPADVDIRDLAHALALINRFNGHTAEPCSVAQHSVFVSWLVPPEHALQGLLHDGSEAYLGDMTRWLKSTPEMAAYREAEHRAQDAVYTKFKCPLVTSQLVHDADRVMVRYEARRGYGRRWHPGPGAFEKMSAAEAKRLKICWHPWSWSNAEKQFLDRYNKLTGRRAR